MQEVSRFNRVIAGAAMSVVSIAMTVPACAQTIKMPFVRQASAVEALPPVSADYQTAALQKASDTPPGLLQSPGGFNSSAAESLPTPPVVPPSVGTPKMTLD